MEHSAGVDHVVVHGYRRAFRVSGSGPALLLLHGLGCDSSTWLDVIPELSKSFTVIAPDLLGHGESDKPDADYSLGGYANGMRDLITVLGIDKVTVVGHSFGGGVAMQFAYQFPERTERVVLVSTGGLGKEITPLVRFMTVPGSAAAIGAATLWPLRPVVAAGMRALARSPLSVTRDLGEVARIYEGLADPARRRAVQRVTSHVVNWSGQLVTMTDRSYLAGLMPVLVVWGRQDMVIPSRHADLAPSQVSDIHVLDDSGHFPHKDHPAEFCRLVKEFIATNEPARYHRGRWRALLRRGDLYELQSVPTGDGVAPAVS